MQIRELFTDIDLNGDGTLDARELMTALNRMCGTDITHE